MMLSVRADAGDGVGFGHLARCLALAQAWRDVGGQVVLAADAPPEWIDRYRAESADVVPVDGWRDAGAGASWAVVDGYRFNESAVADARRGGARVLAIDDHGATTGVADADLVLDQNLGAAPASYASVSRDRLLLGTSYALIRREIRARRPSGAVAPGRVERLAVAVGGAPPPGVTELIDRALADGRLGDLAVERLVGVQDVGEVLARCHLALSAAGSTTWELCCLGVPSVLLAIADNQRPLSAATGAAGAALDAGWYGDVPPRALAALVADLAADEPRRQDMSQRARELVDGLGARRVVARMRGLLLDLRPVAEGDARLLWEWANDPQVRANAFTPEPIPWGTHVAWLDQRLRDPSALLFLAADGDRPLGTVRFDGVDGPEPEISITVADRGRGWGPAIIDRAVRELFTHPAPSRVVARILPENRASATAFAVAGFTPDGMGRDGASQWLQYARRRDVDDR